jgi:hypothetical protein
MIVGDLSQGGFSFLDNRSKRRFFVHCQISQNLTVDFDRRFFQASDETAACLATRNTRERAP